MVGLAHWARITPGIFLTWLAVAAIDAHSQRNATEKVLGERRRWRVVVDCAGGLFFLVANPEVRAAYLGGGGQG